MRNAVVRVSTAGLAILLLLVPVSGHHEVAAKFDPAKTVTLSGVVTDIEWLNPHVHVFVNVAGAGGLTSWAVELESVVDLRDSGWRRDSVKPGDVVTIQGIVARDGTPQVWAKSMALKSTGKQVFNVTSPPKSASTPTRPTPRWPDGQPRLGPPPGETGYWGRPSATMLIQSGADVRADAQGLLQNPADVDKVAPLQTWARGIYYLRQREFLKDDPMYQSCLPPGGPRMYQVPYGVQFMEERDRQRIWVFMGGANHNWRHIYLDGRKLPPQDEPQPWWYGYSVGHWEGDTLVVETNNLRGAEDGPSDGWLDVNGSPYSEQAKFTERFRRPLSITCKSISRWRTRRRTPSRGPSESTSASSSTRT